MSNTTTPQPLHSLSTLDAILHAFILAGMTAASIFIKNPNSQAKAAPIINLVNEVLPVIDTALNPPPADPPAPPTQ